MRKLVSLTSGAVICMGALSVSASAATYAVGTCKPNLTSFTTISQALSTIPSGSTVDVCPGTYAEQVVITQPLTLQGVVIGGANAAIVAVPAHGMSANTTDGNGTVIGAQIVVESTGPVNISDLVVDGNGGSLGGCPNTMVGIYYHSSSGTVNHAVVRNGGSTGTGCLEGILLENDNQNSAPSVTVSNSSVHDFGAIGIYATTGPLAGNLAFNIMGNAIGNSANGAGMLILNSAGGTVTNNTVETVSTGIVVQGAPTVAKTNRVSNTSGAFVIVSEGNTIQSNTTFSSSGIAFSVLANNNQILANSVSNSDTAFGLYCALATSGNLVKSNTITEANVGIANNGNAGNTVSPNITYGVGSVIGPCVP